MTPQKSACPPPIRAQGLNFQFAMSAEIDGLTNEKNLHNPKFQKFFHAELALSMIQPKDLNQVIKKIKDWKMDTDELENDKNKYLNHFHNT